MRLSAGLLATVVLASPAFAEQPKPTSPPKVDIHEPLPGPLDSRLRTWAYRPGVVMTATSTALTPLRIIFEPGEVPLSVLGARVVSAVSGKDKPDVPATEWFGVLGQNDVTLQPLHPGIPPSFVFLNTVQNGETHAYTIELKTRDDGRMDDDGAYIQVTITRAPSPAANAAVATAQRAKAAIASAIQTRLTQARYGQGPRNWHYVFRGDGCRAFAPTGLNRNWISDDGHQTAVLFYGHKRSAVFTTTDDEGDPELITPTTISHRVGTLYMLPATYETLEIRRGRLVCQIKPERFDSQGTVNGNGSGTISPNVLLLPRQQK